MSSEKPAKGKSIKDSERLERVEGTLQHVAEGLKDVREELHDVKEELRKVKGGPGDLEGEAAGRSKPRSIWVIGNAVQDVTLDLIDLERMALQYPYIRQMIRLEDQPKFVEGLWLKTRYGQKEFAVEIRMDTELPGLEGFYSLKPGGRHDLAGEVLLGSGHVPKNTPNVFVPCDSLAWGGGGLNCIKFLRSLVPDRNRLPVTYTDVAMSRTLHVSIRKLTAELRHHFDPSNKGDLRLSALGHLMMHMMESKPAVAAALTSKVAEIFSDYSPDQSMEVYLASLAVDFRLYRPEAPPFRRNLVFSRLRSLERQVSNKIILKGKYAPLAETAEQEIYDLLKPEIEEAGAIVLDSVKDGPLFRVCYSLYKESLAKDPSVIGVLAMTTSMQEFLDWMIDHREDGHFPPFILVFNEEEIISFARHFDAGLQEFMKSSADLPDIYAFSKAVLAIREQFKPKGMPRIYVTIGTRGCLGVDEDGHMAYVYRYSKPGSVIYDTNACGDAFCATITLLEWAKRHGYPDISEANRDEHDFLNKEMEYFMAVATAAAYAKATNRRGRIDGTEVADLLDHSHLASRLLPNPEHIIKEIDRCAGLPDERAFTWLTDGNKLEVPQDAKRFCVTRGLSTLLGAQESPMCRIQVPPRPTGPDPVDSDEGDEATQPSMEGQPASPTGGLDSGDRSAELDTTDPDAKRKQDPPLEPKSGKDDPDQQDP